MLFQATLDLRKIQFIILLPHLVTNSQTLPVVHEIRIAYQDGNKIAILHKGGLTQFSYDADDM